MGVLLQAVADFVWPPACPLCAAPMPGDLLCGPCASGLPGFKPGGEPVPLPAGALEEVLALFRYEDPLRGLLLGLKYGGSRRPGRALAELMRRRHPDWERVGRPDLVMPVPLSRRRRWTRGFNQARLLAAPVASGLGIPLAPRGLLARSPRRPQAALDRRRRLANLRGAFTARGVRGRAVVLVDDVVTTGATLETAAAALRAGGARRVRGLCLCWTPPPA